MKWNNILDRIPKIIGEQSSLNYIKSFISTKNKVNKYVGVSKSF